MKYQNIREEELKNKIAQEYFWLYDCTKIVGNVDFCVSMHQGQKQLFEQESLFWAEAKKGSSHIYNSIVQLILTIGKARTFDKFLPPPMLGAFDGEKIAFIPYNEIHDVFYQNDFNWNITPSDYETKEFKLVYKKVKFSIDQKALLFNFEKDDKELKKFIKRNFIVGKFGLTKTKIDKNNFMVIYNKWLQSVKPTIAVNWDLAKKSGIIDGDFYLADLLSQENNTLKEKLFVLLKFDHYELDRKINESGLFSFSSTSFTDKQLAHTQFWNRYDRPPKEEYWDYIVGRRDLLVPQDIRERKGSFFTPQIWVELSQKYLADVLGDDWQEEFYVWDCAAGTGNLLTGLTNKYNIWASTVDSQDVDVMHERIETMNNNSSKGNGANLLHEHVFKFDFLNDDFSELPIKLQEIITSVEKRKKLLIYINPPYAEGDSRIGKGRKNIQKSKIHDKYQKDLGKASGELFAQFFMRIYREIEGCWLAEFSTLKILQAPNFADYRINFAAKLKKMFIVPADTFDNVKGKFPIGFMIWNTEEKEKFNGFKSDVYDENESFIRAKKIYSYDNSKFISELIERKKSHTASEIIIGNMSSTGNDFQNQNALFIENIEKKRKAGGRHTIITKNNLKEICVYFAVRKCIPATWINDRDQFLYPKEHWRTDEEFQNDCLIYTLFSNNIQSHFGPNHWIPFTEQEINAREKFESNFMTKFINGKIKEEEASDLFNDKKLTNKTALKFSPEAKKVLNAGKLLWQYYHGQPKCDVNASLYDIRAYFQGRNESGKMNNKSEDQKYTKMLLELRDNLKALAKKIEPKVYEYEFLKL